MGVARGGVSCIIRQFASLASPNQLLCGCPSLALGSHGGHLHMPHPIPPTTSAFLCLINHHQQFNVLNYFLQNDTPWCHISSMKFSMNFTAKLLEGFSVRWLTVLLYSFLCSFTPRGPLKLLAEVTNGLPESQLIRKPGFAYYCCLCDLEPVSHFFLTLLLCVS